MSNDLEKAYVEYQELLEEYRVLKAQYEEVLNKILELEILKENLQELSKNKEVEGYTNIGGMIFMKSKVLDTENVLVNIGYNIYTEKKSLEVIEILDRQKKNYEMFAEEIKKELESITAKLKDLKEKLEKLAE